MNELSEQNDTLVQTVEELEREANERISLLEAKLNKTNVSLKVKHRFTLVNVLNICIRITCFSIVPTNPKYKPVAAEDKNLHGAGKGGRGFI